ncbi:MerR family transcriptional regulator [Bacillus cereus]|uniref:MerR family transcriptional regulator n=1 Tax=Bacillus cereus TaxID=1396 RepID=UPI001155283F
MTDEIVYSASEVYKRLGIRDSSLRKYMEVLQREGFVVKKDKRGRREYSEGDIIVIERLVELSKHGDMTLEKAAKMIAQQIEKVDPDLIKEEPEGTSLTPFHIQEQLPQQYNVMAQEMNQGMLEMEKRLSEQAKHSNEKIKASIEQHNERVEKRLEDRDEILMKTLSEMQEYRYEVTAAKEKKSRGRSSGKNKKGYH